MSREPTFRASESDEKPLILKKPDLLARLTNLFNDAEQDDVLRTSLFSNPAGLLKAYGVFDPSRNIPVNQSNQLLYAILSSPYMKKWIKEYNAEIVEKYGKSDPEGRTLIDTAKINKIQVARDFLEAVEKSEDPQLISALKKQLPETLPDGFSPVAVVVVVVVALVLVEAIALVQELVEVSHIVASKDTLGRRDMAVLFDALGKDLQGYAELYREKISSKEG